MSRPGHHERDLYAEMRGHCIHSIRALLLGRQRKEWGVSPFARKHVRISVACEVQHLRDLGPGPVEQPVCSDGRGVLGDVVAWWGPR